MLLLQRKPKPGRTNHSTGPHAARGLDIAGLEYRVWKVPSFFWKAGISEIKV